MSAEIATIPLQGKALEEFVVRGNLAALSPADKATHYIALCQSLGLNPATKPFEYITLQGKEVLYARRDCTDQLRKIHNVSVAIVSREQVGDVFQVTARATLPNGRQDESIGAVTVGGLKGDYMANALMKCETKAKRRVTLSIVGLGMLDESELETIEPNKFANIVREQPQEGPARPKIVEAPKEKWTSAKPIPDVVLKGFPKQTQADLRGIPLVDMAVDDLEVVIEQGAKAYEAWKQMPNVAPKLLQLLQAIVAEASVLIKSHAGELAPPPEEPPADYDPTTGEVRS